MTIYFVTMTFRADGTYSAVSEETLDGIQANALYWGFEGDSPLKKYRIDDITQSNQGIGELDIYFGPSSGDSVVEGGFRSIKLMGDKLSFDIYNREYGPLEFKLVRQ